MGPRETPFCRRKQGVVHSLFTNCGKSAGPHAERCPICGRCGNRGFKTPDQSGTGDVPPNPFLVPLSTPKCGPCEWTILQQNIGFRR